MIIYTVESGETLAEICRQFAVDESEVIRINDLADPDMLAEGQALVLPTADHYYTVRRGDTVFSLSQRFGRPMEEIYRDNPPLRDRPLIEGETMILSGPFPKYGPLAVNGYAYAFMDTKLLEEVLPYLTYLTVFSYGVRRDGTLINVDDEALIELAGRYGVAPVMLLTTISEEGTFNSEVAREVLENEPVQDALIGEVTAKLLEKGYRGVDVDFEYIPGDLSEEYAAFLERMRAALTDNGLLLFVSLAPKTYAGQPGILYEAHDYAALGAQADKALIMTYEWGYTYGPPMAIAPIKEVRRVVSYAVTEIPPEKLLLGMPNYAYDWTLPFVKGESAAVTLGNPQAAALAAQTGAQILFDETAASPHFNYNDGSVEHEVWFEDGRSVTAKLELIRQFKLSGIGVWNLMRRFSALWYLIDYYYDILKI